ncbi:hypothetical protein EG68_11895 [Paragonimus skrjabini miyazakii]|uniref:Uncharacterized protein n=1 Tax=Paragonimus skrjabini miyazakii TaxID=59628 RepID=A0A8S9YCF8_9TREM|nr:hypothetical protein EG68_11895 [Paragonimus skrjabini miyazakii]
MYSVICITVILQLVPKSCAQMTGFVLTTAKLSQQSLEHLPWSLEQLNMLYQHYDFHGRKLRQIHRVFLNRIHEPVDMSCWSRRLFESNENENELRPRYHIRWFIKEINLTKMGESYFEYMTERSSTALRVDPLTAIRDKYAQGHFSPNSVLRSQFVVTTKYGKFPNSYTTFGNRRLKCKMSFRIM